MMHDMTENQLWLFWMANWATALAYTYIPLQLVAARSIAGGLGTTGEKLFEWFVMLCGVHHWFHPPAMYFGWWWPAIGVDISMAAVSLLAAFALHKATRNDRSEN